jgi:hypothetical protein
MKTNTLIAILALSLSASTAARADFAVSTGYDYITGKYGLSVSTNYSALAVTPEYTTEDWTIKLNAPYVRLTTPAGITWIGNKPYITGNVKFLPILRAQGMTLKQFLKLSAQERSDFIAKYAPSQTNSGLGDIDLSTRYNAYHNKDNGWDIGVTGAVSFGTADSDKGLGTGRAEYDLSVDISKTLGRFTPSISFGYHKNCNLEGVDLRDYLYGSIGSSFWITDNTNISLTFTNAQRSSDSGNIDNELYFSVNHNVTKHCDIEVHALTGLSQGTPDWGAGASVRFSF